MTTETIDALSNHQLAQLLKLDDLSPWEESESAQVLRHQLAAPMLADLASIPDVVPNLKELQRQMKEANIPLEQSFIEQLLSPAPMLDLLHLIKHFCRQVRDEQANPLRGTPATVLYYASIAAALAATDQRITQVPDAQLRERFAWAAKQKGLSALQVFLPPELQPYQAVQPKDLYEACFRLLSIP